MTKPELGSDELVKKLKNDLQIEVRLNLLFQEKIELMYGRIDQLTDELSYYLGREKIINQGE